MMMRDQQCLIDYLQTRSEVDPDRIGATGMSMGCTGSWWLAALDDRIKAIVGVCCFTRFTELLAHGNLRAHGIYYFVPGLLSRFDSEAIYSLVAPRPMLMLSGDQDAGAPTDGVITLENKLGAVYRLYGKPENFRSVIYQDTGHEYLPRDDRRNGAVVRAASASREMNQPPHKSTCRHNRKTFVIAKLHSQSVRWTEKR